jgi:hypothetical protein
VSGVPVGGGNPASDTRIQERIAWFEPVRADLLAFLR